jgi:hypothetical protein
MRHQTAAGIGNGNVVRDTHFHRLALTCGDDSPRIGEVERKGLSRHVNLLGGIMVTGAVAPSGSEKISADPNQLGVQCDLGPEAMETGQFCSASCAKRATVS